MFPRWGLTCVTSVAVWLVWERWGFGSVAGHVIGVGGCAKGRLQLCRHGGDPTVALIEVAAAIAVGRFIKGIAAGVAGVAAGGQGIAALHTDDVA